jgi:hypothetical protein
MNDFFTVKETQEGLTAICGSGKISKNLEKLLLSAYHHISCICQHTEVTVNPTGESWCDQCGEQVYPSPPFIEAGIVYTTTQEIENE